MRRFAALVIFSIGFTACKSGAKKETQQTATATTKTPSTRTITVQTNSAVVRPADAVVGRVIAVRDQLRFVIIDFTGSRMPRLEQRLSVYRLDQKVAEVKISGPYLGTTVAADITAGDALPGDLVRDH
jgi:hypothetical protein